MKSQWHMALLYASIGISVVSLTSWYRTGNPFQSFVFSLATALAMGILGYAIGHIVGNPKGKSHPDTPVFLQELLKSPFSKPEDEDEFPTSSTSTESSDSAKPLTGEETFVEDLK